MLRFTIVLAFLTYWYSSPEYTQLEEGLVAYYSFDQCDARDDSGNGSDGVLHGRVSCWCGINEKGLLFDGVNDFVTFSGRVNRYFSTSDFTLSFYFKTEGYSVFPQSLVSKRTQCDEYQMLDILLNRAQQTIETELHETPRKYFPDIAPDYIQDGWHHFVLVRSGRIATTYINGSLVRQAIQCSGVDISNETELNIGDSPCIGGGGARRFKGILDELRVYDRALEKEEVEQLYLRYPIEKANADCFS